MGCGRFLMYTKSLSQGRFSEVLKNGDSSARRLQWDNTKIAAKKSGRLSFYVVNAIADDCTKVFLDSLFFLIPTTKLLLIYNSCCHHLMIKQIWRLIWVLKPSHISFLCCLLALFIPLYFFFGICRSHSFPLHGR